MCGISAWIRSNEIRTEKFRKFNDIVRHRGPDAGQVKFYSVLGRRIALGHRRLSIIDLAETANQPMIREGRSIIFNGEIYNYLELRKKLEDKGVKFRTNSDTEVLLAAYITWGKNFLHKLNGMFSFLILDTKNGEIFFARDRFGIKPIYYYEDSSGFYFASEIKQFTTLESFFACGNINTICNFIQNRYMDYNNETFFKNVFQLKGGEAGILNLKDMKLSTYRWYDLRLTKKNKDSTFSEIFHNSIEYRLRSDVEVGSCLSGGIDSNSIVFTSDKKLRTEERNYTLQTFTSCFDELKYDERELVEITKEKTSIKSHYVFPEKNNFFNDLRDLVWFQDGPIWSGSMYAQTCVFKKAKLQGVSVMLDGQGADEIFGGYKSIFYPAFFNELSLVQKFIELFKSRNKQYILKLWLGKLFSRKKADRASVFSVRFDNKYKHEFLSLNDCVLHMIDFHLPALLHFEDRNSMRYSIEARLPFLDYRLVECGYHLDGHERVGQAIGKKIIRKSMAGIVPRAILANRVKKGFITPQRSWLSSNNKRVHEQIIKLTGRDIFHKQSIQAILKGLMCNDFDEGLIMRLLSLSVWFEVFNVKEVK